MTTYLTTLITASLTVSLVTLLSPDGERAGIAKHMRLLTGLFLICVLISPLFHIIEGLCNSEGGAMQIPGIEQDQPPKESYQEQLDQAMSQASTSYFTQMLTQMIESQFAISEGNIRCTVEWDRSEETPIPRRVTVVLSGKAIWKDPRQIEAFVTNLIGCECVSAIE